MKLKIYTILFLLFASTHSYSDALGIGNVSCGEIIRTYENNEEKNKFAVSYFLNGFISGANSALSDTKTGKHQTDDSLFYALVKYCGENPLSNMVDGAIEIYMSLR